MAKNVLKAGFPVVFTAAAQMRRSTSFSPVLGARRTQHPVRQFLSYRSILRYFFSNSDCRVCIGTSRPLMKTC